MLFKYLIFLLRWGIGKANNAQEMISLGIVIIIGNDFYIKVEETKLTIQNANLQKALA